MRSVWALTSNRKVDSEPTFPNRCGHNWLFLSRNKFEFIFQTIWLSFFSLTVVFLSDWGFPLTEVFLSDWGFFSDWGFSLWLSFFSLTEVFPSDWVFLSDWTFSLWVFLSALVFSLWLRFFSLTEVFLNLTEVFLTLTEVFPCFFLSCKANARVKLTKTGHGPHSSTLVVICVVRSFT